MKTLLIVLYRILLRQYKEGLPPSYFIFMEEKI